MARISWVEFVLAISVTMFFVTPSFGVPQTSSGQTIAGIVVAADGTPINGAQVSLDSRGGSTLAATATSIGGKFALEIADAGNYVLKVRKDGFVESQMAVSLPSTDERPLKIALVRTTGSEKPAQGTGGMEFSDKPDFTVAGITDWTAAGGHGSDVNLRASEALARDTRALRSSEAMTAVRGSKPERELRAAVIKDPTSFKANHELGEFCLRQKQFVDAIVPLEKAHQLNAGDFKNSYNLAQAYDGAGRYAEAKSLASQLLAQNDRPELHRLLGDIEEQLNNPLASEREYERAVQLQPSEENYFGWGGELLQHRAVEAAIDVFTKGTKAFPRSERMFAGLGAALYAHGSYEEGAQRVCDAADLNPSDPQPYLFLGKMEQASPRTLPCVSEKLARFAHDQPNNAWANYYYAVSLLKPDESTQSKQAEKLLENAVRIDPKFALAHLQLGVLKSERGDWQVAKESYEKAAASDPTLPDPHFRLAQVYRRLGDEQKASQELHTFESLKKSDAAAVEQQRREIRQFVVVMKDAPAAPAN
jgi:tetratricopeptide (TPR) repeat protein